MPEKIRDLSIAIMMATLMTLTGAFALLLRLLSGGLLTGFCRTVVVARSSRFILWLMGIRLELPPAQAYPRGQVLYTFNHNYYLDVLIITALGLKNTRFVLSAGTIKLLPLTVSALAIGTYYIPRQKDHTQRVAFFRKMAEKMQHEGFSLFASSEGQHTFIHGIAPFNKGIYHLALSNGLPLVPVYFHVPEAINPLERFSFRRGTVRVELLPPLDTRQWQVDQLDQHVTEVRQLYLEKYAHAHATENRLQQA